MSTRYTYRSSTAPMFSLTGSGYWCSTVLANSDWRLQPDYQCLGNLAELLTLPEKRRKTQALKWNKPNPPILWQERAREKFCTSDTAAAVGWRNALDRNRKDPRCEKTGTLIDMIQTPNPHSHVRRCSHPRWELFPSDLYYEWLAKNRHYSSEGGRRGEGGEGGADTAGEFSLQVPPRDRGCSGGRKGMVCVIQDLVLYDM